MIDIDKIEAAAKAAQIEWPGDFAEETLSPIGLHITTSNPTTILKMVSMIRERDAILLQALDVLEHVKPMVDCYWGGTNHDKAIEAIKEILK
jgi:hypothetical protein